jgi:ABC-type uncharacterized transport system permease subunit
LFKGYHPGETATIKRISEIIAGTQALPAGNSLIQDTLNLKDRNAARHILILIFSFSSVGILAWFLKTSLGLQILATGNK